MCVLMCVYRKSLIKVELIEVMMLYFINHEFFKKWLIQ